MDENAKEKLRELGFTYNKSEEHCRINMERVDLF
jgi:hypothetical protein